MYTHTFVPYFINRLSLTLPYAPLRIWVFVLADYANMKHAQTGKGNP